MLIGLFAVPFQFQLICDHDDLGDGGDSEDGDGEYGDLEQSTWQLFGLCHTFPVSDGDNDVADAG